MFQAHQTLQGKPWFKLPISKIIKEEYETRNYLMPNVLILLPHLIIFLSR